MSAPSLPEELAQIFRPDDSLERQNEKLLRIASSLIRHSEAAAEPDAAGYAQFHHAAMLEDQVRTRTRDLERALDLLNISNAQLAAANRETGTARQNLAAAVETIQEGFALFDANDVLIMCNSRFNALLPDIVDKLVPGLSFTDYLQLVAGSQHLKMLDGMSRAEWIGMRQRRHDEHHFILTQPMGPDRWVQVSEHRTRDGGTAILQTEVTDLIRKERQERGRLLDDQAQILHSTLEHLKLGVCIFDARLYLLGWNERLAEFLTLPRTRLRQGMQFDQLFDLLIAQFDFPHGHSHHRLASWVRSVRRKDSFRTELQRKGSRQIYDIIAQETPGGGFVMSVDDVTAERHALLELSRANETLEARVAERTLKLEDALSQAERANSSRARFVAAASHDLLQPLSAATLYLASLQDEAMGERAQKTIDKVQRSLDSVETLLGALLDISRLESGNAAVSIEPIALGPLFDQLREEFTPLAELKGLRLIIRPATGIVMSDQIYLRRILQNLISNAIRYTASGRVFVGVRRRGPDWLVEVRDSGPGIAEAEQSQIFREFHRGGARSSASEGLGLGLAIVERASLLLGHQITLQSALGKGSTFAVGLKAGRAERAAVVATAATQPGRGEDEMSRTVLLVENDADLAHAMVELLEKWGLTVLDVPSGEAALDLIAETGLEPDLCLVDYQLGEGMDGIACLGALRARFGRDLPVRLVTADRSEEVQERAAEAEIQILMKPVAPRTLAAFIATSG